MGKSPSPPPAPDYRGAAQAQGAANVEAARAAGKLNNPNVFGPYGTQTVTYDGDQPTLTQTLSPAQQQLLEQQQGTQQQLGNLANIGAKNVQGVLQQPLSFAGAPPLDANATATRDRAFDALMARTNEDYGQRSAQLKSDLAAAGHQVGDTGYDYQTNLLQRGLNDVRNQAFLAAGQEASRDFGINQAARNQFLQELMSQRQTPINEITALMSGSQVQSPFNMPGYAQNAQIAPAPIFGATEALGNYNADLYNARAASAASLNQGLFGLGGAGLMGAGMAAGAGAMF